MEQPKTTVFSAVVVATDAEGQKVSHSLLIDGQTVECSFALVALSAAGDIFLVNGVGNSVTLLGTLATAVSRRGAQLEAEYQQQLLSVIAKLIGEGEATATAVSELTEAIRSVSIRAVEEDRRKVELDIAA